MPISTITLNNGTQVQVQPDASGNLTDKGVNQNSNYQGLYNPDGSQQNPVSSSTGIRADYTALGNDIKTYANSTGLSATNDANTKLLTDRMTQLKEQQDAAIAQIKSDYTVADATQTARQNKDYGGTSTNLITSGGGFLGYTGSQAGVLQSLKNTFETEKTALLSKRDAAISQAKNAYDDKQFALAQSLIKEAKDSEQELYQRQKDYNAQQLNLAQEARSADTYQRTFADDKAKAYALLSDEDFAKLSPAQLKQVDDFYYPGYAAQFHAISQATNAGKTIENDLKYKNDLQTLINKTPQGQKITLPDGTTVMGMKKPIGVSTSGLIAPVLANQLGVPSLAGKDEGDVILSLAFETAPSWYRDYHKSAGLPEKDVQADWKVFKELPDISAYAKSSVVTSRIAGTNSFSAITAKSIGDAIANANAESGN